MRSTEVNNCQLYNVYAESTGGEVENLGIYTAKVFDL